jgi:hypothetical protein
MSMNALRRAVSAGILTAALFCPPPASAQQAARPQTPADPPGVDIFAGAGAAWPAAKDSFDALGLDSSGLEFGGGVRFTGLWKKLFAQAAVHRWTDSGERAFVDDDGNVFPLGIALDAEATYIDATIGWKEVVRNSAGRISFLTYVGAGAGVVQYSESSPLASDGDDLDATKVSYNLLGGVEMPLGRVLAVAVDGRYRFIPDVLGEGGVSSSFDEDFLGGFQFSVGLRLGFGGPRYVVPPPKPTPPAAAPGTAPSPGARLDGGVIVATAPVFLLPDSTRTPLRTLTAGTIVRILEEKGDWVRIEFRDTQYGARVGFVQRKFVQVRNQED